MFPSQRHKITALLEHLRAWTRGDAPLDALELADAYALDAFVVRRLGESEDVHFLDHGGVPTPIYDDEDTAPIQLRA